MQMGFVKKVLLSITGLGVVGSMLGMGTFASFQAQSTNAANTFSSGYLRIANVAGTAVSGSNCTSEGSVQGVLSGNCATLFNAAIRVPGDSSRNTVTLTNAGNLSGFLSLSLGTVTTGSADTSTTAPVCATASQSNYKSQIGVRVSDGNSANDVTGTLASPPSFSQRSIAAGASQTYTITLTFNSTGSVAGDNPLQNCLASAPMNWTLEPRLATTSTSGT